ncbi:tetratricopeptide repeat-containing sulfotransferase family protein [Aliiroseovarius subalbicans]|uniref:tetratricopeptide repeat-containing sulfotransferase family protein n=1 Tax=Aliiroseovarius subalbicans TaxID=2925840 RepID=UPI001F570111|nr:tetratricopeptide repeat-containing sulfotransferase family protein [Aliiroseovarius subalbicans]MCI2398299.1 sulfotransferase [Aliiroseovarius subalbicans]
MLPLNANQIPILYKNAVALMRSGKAPEAIKAFQDLARMAPSRAEFEFHIGQMLFARAEIRPALKNFAKAASKAPGQKAIWLAYADALASLGDKEAIEEARQALIKSPLNGLDRKEIRRRMQKTQTSSKRTTTGVDAKQIQAFLRMIETGKAASVVQETEILTRANPKNEILFNVHAIGLSALGRFDEAEQAFKRALELDPKYPEARAHYGEVLLQMGRRLDAMPQLKIARTLIPNSPIVLGNLGRLYLELGRPNDALDCLNALLKTTPNVPIALYSRGIAYQMKQEDKAALADFDRVVKLAPDFADIHAVRAKSLVGDDAMAAAKLAIKQDENSPTALATMASLLSQKGEFDAATDMLLGAIRRGISKGGMYRQISVSRKFTVDDPLIAEMETAWEDNTLDADNRADLGFALTKAMEDTKQYDKVWPYLKTACDQLSESYPYNRDNPTQETDALMDFFRDFDLSRVGTTGYEDDQTIFVTGLPRSGTTLVEQIVSSHSTVTGTGEIGIFSNYAAELRSAYEEQTVSQVSDKELVALGKRYSEEVRARFPEADRTADKSIGTFQLAGLNWLSMPNSKLVVLRRDPRDNLFSIFKNRFASGQHLYSYDLETLVEVYRNFLRMLDFWREIAPDRMYEIQYEELVANPEAETRKLLEFCDLEWEDDCLNFHQNKRQVNTLSVYQVRQPMYKSSVAAWRRYEEHLGPLLDGLKGMEGLRD